MLRRLSHPLTQLILIVMLVLVYAGIIALLWLTNAAGWRSWRMTEVQQFIGAALPTTAQEVQFSARPTGTRIIWLRAQLAPQAMQSFLAELGIPALRDSFTPFPAPNPQEAGILWWQPYTVTAFQGAHHNTGRQIMEALYDPATTTLYLRVYNLRRT
jgi:hypothetical protein